jgi:hypothetical protein
VIHLVLPALAPNDARMIFRARSDVRALPYEADAPGKFTPSVMCQGVRFALILLAFVASDRKTNFKRS